MKDLSTQLDALLRPLAHQHGLELVGAETARARGSRVIRVFLDCEGGIDLDALAAANRWVSDALDTVDDLQGPYTLEVSSPGIERPLVSRSDWERFDGSTASIKLTDPLDGRSSITGIIVGLEGDDVLIDDGVVRRIPLCMIGRARLKADFTILGEGTSR